MLKTLLSGIGGVDIALLAIRATLGTFFAVTGCCKLVRPEWHKSMHETMEWLKIPFPRFNAWFVAGVEFSAGLGILVGCLTPLAALGIVAVMAVALITDGPRMVAKLEPGDKLERADDWLYLPETLYVAMAIVLIAMGAGAVSIDAILMAWLA